MYCTCAQLFALREQQTKWRSSLTLCGSSATATATASASVSATVPDTYIGTSTATASTDSSDSLPPHRYKPSANTTEVSSGATPAASASATAFASAERPSSAVSAASDATPTASVQMYANACCGGDGVCDGGSGSGPRASSSNSVPLDAGAAERLAHALGLLLSNLLVQVCRTHCPTDAFPVPTFESSRVHCTRIRTSIRTIIKRNRVEMKAPALCALLCSSQPHLSFFQLQTCIAFLSTS